MPTYKILKSKATFAELREMKLNRLITVDAGYQVIHWTNEKGQQFVDAVRLEIPWDSYRKPAWQAAHEVLVDLGCKIKSFRKPRQKADIIILYAN